MDDLSKKALTAVYSLLLFSMLMASGVAISTAANKATQKQKVIAGAIYKFIKFIDWEEGLSEDQGTFDLCLQQYDPAFEPLTKRNINGKTIRVLVFGAENKGENCHAVYLNSKQVNQTKIISQYRHKPVLTISKQPGFVDRGGVIELGNYNNRLIFSINLKSAKTSRLNVGFQLLSLARKVVEI